MNLISNCCIGGYLYQKMGQQFENPFQWCFIEPDDMFYLIAHFNVMNFNNIKLDKSTEHKNTYVLTVDGHVKLKYIHYMYDKNISFKQQNHNIKSNHIETYIINKYHERLKRMKSRPIFLYVDHIHKSYDGDAIRFIQAGAHVNFKKILITRCNAMLEYNNNNTLVIFDDNMRQVENNYPIDYCNRYFDVMSPFIIK